MGLLEVYKNGVTNSLFDNGIAPDKKGYPHIFLISPQKRMLWLLIRSTLARCL